MEMPMIEINQQFGRLGLDIRSFEAEVDQVMDEVQIRTSKAQLEIQAEEANLQIDHSPTRQDLGLYNYKERGRQFAQEGMQTALNRTAYYAQLGDRLMDFQNNSIGNIAAEDTAPEEKEIEYQYLSPPEVNIEPGEVQVSAEPGEVEVQSQMTNRINRPEMQFQHGDVEVYLEQEPQVEIIPPGQHINAQA